MNPILADLAYGAAWRGLRAVPGPVAHAAFRRGSTVARGDGLRANLARVVPPAALDAVVREGMASYARYWCETFRLRPGDASRLVTGTRVTNPGPFRDALDAGRGLVLAMPHSGNWDAAGVWLLETLRRHGLTPAFTTVAQRLDPPSVYRRFVAHRERLGFEIVAADDPGAYRALLARLRSGGVVCMLADRDIAGTGVDVRFFGAPARFPAGPARLAALTGAALLPTHLGFVPGGWTIAFADPVPVPGPRDVGKATQALADALGALIARQPADWHVLAPIWTGGTDPPWPAGRCAGGVRPTVNVGLVCPYSLDVPGGVQAHVLGLAGALRRRGHGVQVLAPAEGPVPPFVTPVGRTLGVPYNGSVARVAFGPVSYGRVRRWLAAHRFDVLHLHEPTTVSVSALALLLADGPIVATFHTSTERSRTLAALGGVARPMLEKVTARIAVSPAARRVQVEHLGGDAIEIPNGVDVAAFAIRGRREPATVAFVGRYDEPRKGMPVLLEALRRLGRPDVRLRVVGRGDAAALRRAAGAVPVDVLGPVDDAEKAAVLARATVFCAPHTGGESFGMVLAEAMAAGAPVVASDLDAFRGVLGPAGALVPSGDAAALAAALGALLDDPARRARLAAAGRARVAAFDWPVVAAAVERVYRAAVAADPRRAAS